MTEEHSKGIQRKSGKESEGAEVVLLEEDSCVEEKNASCSSKEEKKNSSQGKKSSSKESTKHSESPASLTWLCAKEGGSDKESDFSKIDFEKYFVNGRYVGGWIDVPCKKRNIQRMTKEHSKGIQRKSGKETEGAEIVLLEEDSCVEEKSASCSSKEEKKNSSSSSKKSTKHSESLEEDSCVEEKNASCSSKVEKKNSSSSSKESTKHSESLESLTWLCAKEGGSEEDSKLSESDLEKYFVNGRYVGGWITVPCRKHNVIRRSAPKVKASGNEIIVLGDETIVISSGDESEEDIKIEKVLKGGFSGSEGRKGRARSLSERIVTAPVEVKQQKRKRTMKNSPQSSQRRKKSKKSQDTAGCSGLRVSPLTENTSHRNSGSGSSTNTKHSFDNNLINSESSPTEKTGLRPIIIDGLNVGTEGRVFRFKKLEICITYFQKRNHKVIAFLPRYAQGRIQGKERERMVELETKQILCFTPSRVIPGGKRVAAYDDRFIVQAATELDGVIVSNDNYRDIMEENERWKQTIKNRLLMYTWVGDMLMFPNDPLGQSGPHLLEFLCFPQKKEGKP